MKYTHSLQLVSINSLKVKAHNNRTRHRMIPQLPAALSRLPTGAKSDRLDAQLTATAAGLWVTQRVHFNSRRGGTVARRQRTGRVTRVGVRAVWASSVAGAMPVRVAVLVAGRVSVTRSV